MSERLTDEDRREWEQHLITLQESYGVHEIVFAPVDLCALVESEKTGWAEADKWRIEAMKQHPTQDAYDTACSALWKHREDNEKLREEVERLKEKYYTEQERAEKFIDEAYKQIKENERLNEKLQDALNTLERIVAMPYTLPDVCKDFAQLLSKETIQRIQEGK